MVPETRLKIIHVQSNSGLWLVTWIHPTTKMAFMLSHKPEGITEVSVNHQPTAGKTLEFNDAGV
jgi:hypothetical protein